MNGRVYDPTLGRFIQADPHIQAPSDSQSLNRYSYVKNNPLSYTDPTGFFFKKLKKAIMKITGMWAIHKYLANHAPWAVGLISTVLNFVPVIGQALSAAFTADHNFFLTGSLTSSVKSFATSYLGASAMSGIGGSDLGGFGKVIAHGMVGGIMSELQGGKFGHGFASAAMGKAVTNAFGASFAKNPALGLTVTAIVGGTSSVISGGKFANGAATAAMGFIFNFMNNEMKLQNGNFKSKPLDAAPPGHGWFQDPNTGLWRAESLVAIELLNSGRMTVSTPAELVDTHANMCSAYRTACELEYMLMNDGISDGFGAIGSISGSIDDSVELSVDKATGKGKMSSKARGTKNAVKGFGKMSGIVEAPMQIQSFFNKSIDASIYCSAKIDSLSIGC